jgi:hypothetical protein
VPLGGGGGQVLLVVLVLLRLRPGLCRHLGRLHVHVGRVGRLVLGGRVAVFTAHVCKIGEVSFGEYRL